MGVTICIWWDGSSNLPKRVPTILRKVSNICLHAQTNRILVVSCAHPISNGSSVERTSGAQAGDREVDGQGMNCGWSYYYTPNDHFLASCCRKGDCAAYFRKPHNTFWGTISRNNPNNKSGLRWEHLLKILTWSFKRLWSMFRVLPDLSCIEEIDVVPMVLRSWKRTFLCASVLSGIISPMWIPEWCRTFVGSRIYAPAALLPFAPGFL